MSTSLFSKEVLENRDEILEIAKKYGYQEVDPTKWSISEIIYRFSKATHVIAESGGV